MTKFEPNSEIEALAYAMAVMDGRKEPFMKGRGVSLQDDPTGHYEGYMSEASSIAQHLYELDYVLAKQFRSRRDF